MATLQTISGSLLLAEAYYKELVSEYISELIAGAGCTDLFKKIKCLNRLIRALSWDVADEVNDSTTTIIYGLLLREISAYSGTVLTVNPDVVIPTNPIVYDPSGDYRTPEIITVSDFEVDGVTYNDTELAGLTKYLVYLNGVRYLMPGQDFNYLPSGGIQLVEPIYDGQQIILIF